MQSFLASQLLKINNRSQRVVLGGQYGGPGGSHVHAHHKAQGSYKTADPTILNDNINQINIYTCSSGDAVGLTYNYRSNPGHYFHMGCGSNPSHRESVATMNLGQDENIASLEVFHAQRYIASRRIYKLKLCSDSERCIETKEHESKDETYYKRSVYLEGRAKFTISTAGHDRVESGKGPIVGFYGRYGDSIDSIGIYVRIDPEITYNRSLLDNSIEWYNMKNNGYCHQRGKISNSNQMSSSLIEAIQGDPGRCNCDQYFNVSENDPIFGITATCFEL